MNDSDAIQFYGERVVAFARTLPIGEMLTFLRGALAVGGDHPSIDPIRKAHHRPRR